MRRQTLGSTVVTLLLVCNPLLHSAPLGVSFAAGFECGEFEVVDFRTKLSWTDFSLVTCKLERY